MLAVFVSGVIRVSPKAMMCWKGEVARLQIDKASNVGRNEATHKAGGVSGLRMPPIASGYASFNFSLLMSSIQSLRALRLSITLPAIAYRVPYTLVRKEDVNSENLKEHFGSRTTLNQAVSTWYNVVCSSIFNRS